MTRRNLSSIDVTFSASRFDRSAQGLKIAFARWVKTYGMVLFTEVEGHREGAIRSIPDSQVAKVSPIRGSECGALLDHDLYTVRWTGQHLLTTKTWLRSKAYGGKPAAPPSSNDTLVIHKPTGKEILISVVHFPSEVEGESGWGHLAARVISHKSAMKGWRKRKGELRRRFRPDEVLLAADFNLDLRKPWVKAYVKAHFPLMHLLHGSAGSFGKKEGGRAVDGLITTMRGGTGTSMVTGTSDHKVVHFRLRFRRPIGWVRRKYSGK